MRYISVGFLCLWAVTLGAVEATAEQSFQLSYQFSFDRVLEAEVIGELQDDGETVIVSAVKNARLDGMPGPELTFVISLADLVDGTQSNKPVLTLSGTNNDISMCSDPTCTGEFITLDGVKQFLGMPGVYTTDAFGSTYSGGANAGEKFDPKNYQLTPIQSI